MRPHLPVFSQPRSSSAHKTKKTGSSKHGSIIIYLYIFFFHFISAKENNTNQNGVIISVLRQSLETQMSITRMKELEGNVVKMSLHWFKYEWNSIALWIYEWLSGSIRECFHLIFILHLDVERNTHNYIA